MHFVLLNTHHTQVLPVFVLAYDVPQAAEGGTGILVDSYLLVGGGRFVLTCLTKISTYVPKFYSHLR